MIFCAEGFIKRILDIMIYEGSFIILGYGSLGPNTVYELRRAFPSNTIKVITDFKSSLLIRELDVKYIDQILTQENYKDTLCDNIKDGDFVINLTVDVCCADIINWCQTNNVLYIDTAIYQWLDESSDYTNITNYSMREHVLTMAQPTNKTAIIAHGANPGLVNHFVKYALTQIAEDLQIIEQLDWPELAKRVGLKTIQISEIDTQHSNHAHRPGDFINTWSVQGFINEGSQPAELTFGTYDNYNNINVRSDRSAYLNKPGVKTTVLGWNPLGGQYMGWMITHMESISIGQALSTDDYTPSVYYVYRPTSATIASIHDFIANDLNVVGDKILLNENNCTSGSDSLGVLLMGDFGVYWCGNILSCQQTYSVTKYANATTLQVTAPLIGAVKWALLNPEVGIVEPDQLDHNFIISESSKLIGDILTIKVDTWKTDNFTLNHLIVH